MASGSQRSGMNEVGSWKKMGERWMLKGWTLTCIFPGSRWPETMPPAGGVRRLRPPALEAMIPLVEGIISSRIQETLTLAYKSSTPR